MPSEQQTDRTHHDLPLAIKLTPVLVVLALIGGFMTISDPSIRGVELGMGMTFLDVVSMLWLITFGQVMIASATIRARRKENAE